MLLQVHQDTILWWTNTREVQPDPKKLHALTEMPPCNKKELWPFLGIMNGKFFPSRTGVSDPLRKLMSSHCEWTWNSRYQNLQDRAKNTIKKNATIVFCNEKDQQYPETDVSSICLGASLLQERDGIQFPRDEAANNAAPHPISCASKKSDSARTCYSNTEREVLGTAHGLKITTTVAHEVSVITDHQPLIAILQKVASLS